MTTQKHTPGPWNIDKMGSITTYDKSLGRTVRIADIPDHDDEEQAANARLIAAAPDLLAACYEVLNWAKTPGEHGGNPYCKAMVKLARAAISKATGENL